MHHKYILHIGRQKSGTTILQQFLAHNREVLAQAGYYYPYVLRIAHHPLAYAIQSFYKQPKMRAKPSQPDDIITAFQQDVRDANEKHILVSSEYFQNVHPQYVARIFPPDETLVIVYIREQLDFMISAYQQKVHANPYAGSIEEYAQTFGADHYFFLRRWEAEYGRENLMLKVYDRSTLIEGDIIVDFFTTLGIPRDLPFTNPKNPNKNYSIGGNLLRFKLLVNLFDIQALYHNDAIAPWFYTSLGTLAAQHPRFRQKPHVSTDLANQIREKFSDSNAKLFARFTDNAQGFEYRDDLISPNGEPRPDDQELAQDFQIILQHLSTDERANELLIYLANNSLQAMDVPLP